jgi:hypothetical protein
VIKYIGKIILCALSATVGTLVGGMFSTALHLEQPKLPAPMNLPLLGVPCLAAGIVLSIALAALSQRLPGNRGVRFVTIAWFVFAWLGINNTIEASIFTTVGGAPAIVVTMLFPCLFVAGAVVLLFSRRESGTLFSRGPGEFVADRTAAQWIIRLSAAWLAFPIVYFVFGMPVGLMVGKFYQAQAFGLQMPSLGVVIGVQCLRSLIALLAAVPILIVWPGSRSRFARTFGLVLFVVSGLYGLVQAYWMPWTLRSIHSVELLLDSLAYGWLLAVLFLSRAPAPRSGPVDPATIPNYNI